MREKVRLEIEKVLGSNFKLETPPEGFGDYACGVFHLAKERGRSPKEVAEEVSSEFFSSLFEKVEPCGGFINFTISKEALKEELLSITEKGGEYGKKEDRRVAVIEYSSPNIARRMGVGHLRSTIIGESLARIYRHLGWRVEGVNHLGDWGTQFGKLIYQIKKEGVDPSSLTIEKMEELYVNFHKDGDEEEGRKYFSMLEKGEREAREIWDLCVKASMKEFEKTYKELEVEIDHVIGESFYENMLPGIVEEARKIATESEGALIVEFDDMPPAMLLKSDGSTTYFTRDLAAVKYRKEVFKPHLMLYEIGAEQSLHMRQVFRAAEMLGIKEETELFHVAHGMFSLKEGKMSTRKGRVVHLRDVLEEAKRRALLLIKDESLKEKEEVARIVGTGAVKYGNLKVHHKRNIVFDWDEVITLKGDSGPYLQYTALRCKSVLSKGGSYGEFDDLNEEDLSVVREMMRFKECLQDAAENFSPNILAAFAYRLARSYNLFYENYKITGNNGRMAVTEGTFILLQTALHLLTVSLPPKM